MAVTLAQDTDRAFDIISLRALSQLNFLKLFSWILIDWGGVFLCLYFTRIADNWAFDIIAVLVIGCFLHAISILGHDCAHYHLCRNRFFNDFLGNLLCFVPLGGCLQSYRRWHFQHHRKLGAPEDSELLTMKKKFPNHWRLPITRRQVLVRSLKGLIGFEIPLTLYGLTEFRPRKPTEFLVSFIFLSILGVVLYIFHLWWILPYFLAASFLVYPVLTYIRTLFEHSGKGEGSKGTHRLKLTWLESMILSPHNILEYHYEHHQWPSVPFYNLPEARKLDASTPIKSMAETMKQFEMG